MMYSGVFSMHLKQDSGWWYTYPSEKYEFVSWDDEIPTIWKNPLKSIKLIKIH